MQPTKQYLLLLALCLLSLVPASAQRVITGVVYDTQNEPLAGATVTVKENKAIGTTTNVDGSYKIALPDNKNYTLQVSFIGYITRNYLLEKQDRKKNFRLEEEAINMETVVVTGTRTPKTLKDVPVITRVITLEDIRKTDATNIVDVLEMELPAIETSYSMDMQPSLNIQGFSGNAVLFLVDGERLAGETMNDVDFSRLNMDGIERVEIVRGAASSIYGSNAVGGVINIITRASAEPWTANLNSRYGYVGNSQRHGATVSFNAGKFNNNLNVQRISSDQIEFFDPNLIGEKGDYAVANASRSWNFKDRLTFKLNDKIRFAANAGYFYRERDRSNIEQNRYRDFSGGLKGTYDIDKEDYVEVSYAFDQYDKSDFDGIKRLDIRDYSNVQHTFRTLYSHIFNGKHTLTAGADYMRDYLQSYMLATGETFIQHTADVFAQFDWNPTKKFNVVASARYDYYSAAEAQSFSPQLNLMYKVGRCSLRGSYAVGFRAPSLKEMHSSFNMNNVFNIYGNPDLQPEKSHNFSISAEYLKNRYNVTVTTYYNIVNNRIDTLWDPTLDTAGAMKYSNTKKMDIAGANIDASAKYPCGIGIRLSYAYTYQSDRYNQYVSLARPHSATFRLDYGKDWNDYGFNVCLSGKVMSKSSTQEYKNMYDPSQGYEEKKYPAYTMWKLNVTQKLWKGVSMTLTVDNLLNYRPSYYYFNSPYTTGTTLAVGMALDIDRMVK